MSTNNSTKIRLSAFSSPNNIHIYINIYIYQLSLIFDLYSSWWFSLTHLWKTELFIFCSVFYFFPFLLRSISSARHSSSSAYISFFWMCCLSFLWPFHTIKKKKKTLPAAIFKTIALWPFMHSQFFNDKWARNEKLSWLFAGNNNFLIQHCFPVLWGCFSLYPFLTFYEKVLDISANPWCVFPPRHIIFSTVCLPLTYAVLDIVIHRFMMEVVRTRESTNCFDSHLWFNSRKYAKWLTSLQ